MYFTVSYQNVSTQKVSVHWVSGIDKGPNNFPPKHFVLVFHSNRSYDPVNFVFTYCTKNVFTDVIKTWIFQQQIRIDTLRRCSLRHYTGGRQKFPSHQPYPFVVHRAIFASIHHIVPNDGENWVLYVHVLFRMDCFLISQSARRCLTSLIAWLCNHIGLFMTCFRCRVVIRSTNT